MTRARIKRRTIAAAGGAALAALLLLGLSSAAVLPSYLASWLVLLGVGAGALPLLMVLELTGGASSSLASPLRRLLWLLPLAALLALPVLVRLGSIYPWAAAAQLRPATHWFTPSGFAARTIVYLMAWSGLAFVFMRPPADVAAPRRRLATVGLLLHAAVGTLAATDWVLSISPGFGSSAFGLLLMVAQSGMALSVAVLLMPSRRAASRPLAIALIALFGLWAFLQFTQFLVVWSADLPAEVVWYQDRLGAAGLAAAGLALACVLASPLLLVPGVLERWPALLPIAAAAMLLVHAVEMFWLITPSLRGHFRLTPADLLGALAAGGVATALLCTPRAVGVGERVQHGAT